jgi:hypothetical protein
MISSIYVYWTDVSFHKAAFTTVTPLSLSSSGQLHVCIVYYNV